jgi:hypothetical protein
MAVPTGAVSQPAEATAAPAPAEAPAGPKRRRWRRVLPAIAAFVLSVALGFGGFAAMSALEARRDVVDAESRARQLSAQIAALTAERDSLRSQLGADDARVAELESQLSTTIAELERVRESKKVVVTKEVPVPTRVPNGKKITVETTGFEEVVEVYDVHLTHAYGFSDLVGIAENTGGESLEYVQIGCTFLDAQGRVLANVIDNRETWAPGATWGFDCSAEVDATGGVVRVDVAG